MVNLIVIKKNKNQEKYDSKKIVNACKSAGASDEVAKKVAREITDEISFIQSSKIRELALKKLETLDSNAANSWKEFDENVKNR